MQSAAITKNDSLAAPRPDGETKSRRSWILRLFASAAVMGWLIWRIQWPPILDALARVHWLYCAAALALYCAAQVVSGYRWRLIARPLGFDEPWRRFTGLYFVGMFFNLFLPTSMGGDVVRAWRLAGKSGRRGPAFLSVVGERLNGLFALMLMACAATLLAGDAVPGWAVACVWGVTIAGGLGCCLLPAFARYSLKFRSLSESLRLSLLSPRRMLITMGLSFLVQISAVLQIWLLGLSMDLSAPLTAYAVAVPLVTLATLLPISLNGVGIREASLVLLLATAGVSSAAALTLGVLWFVMLLAAGLIGGGVCVWNGFADTRGRKQNGRFRGHSDQGRTRQPAAAA